MIAITSFSKKKTSNNTATTTTNNGGGFANQTQANTAEFVQGVNLWGNWHDHTGDICGSISVSGNIEATDNITAPMGTFSGVAATDGDITNILSDAISTTDITGANATFDNITINNIANFNNLTIADIQSVNGQVIISNANGEVIHVTHDEVNNTYTLYFLADDNNNQVINKFAINDLVISQQFDVSENAGISATSKYYWVKVIEVSDIIEGITIDGVERLCHWIKLDWNIKAANCQGTPTKGDRVAQLGNTTDTNRQNAIVLGSYKNAWMDNSVKAPFIIQYAGINNFNLNTHKINALTGNGNSFTGTFTSSVTGNDIETDYNSLISQTACGITLQLQNTGIDITNNQITLNSANTTVCGNLNLYDNKNAGLTIYDSNNYPSVNIQADSINELQPSRQDISSERKLSILNEMRQNFNVVLTETLDIPAYRQLQMKHLFIFARTNNNLKLTNPTNVLFELIYNNNVVASQTITFTANDDRQYNRNSSEVITYQTAAAGQYTFRWTFQDSTTFATQGTHTIINYTLKQSTVPMTYIGKDGALIKSTAAGEVRIDKDNILLRNGSTGLRLTDNVAVSGAITGGAGLQTIVTTNNSGVCYLPFYNYKPSTILTAENFVSRPIVNLGNTNRYVYLIDSQRDAGMIIVEEPAKNTNGDYQTTTWIELPHTTIYDDYGSATPLPKGYMVTIINNTYQAMGTYYNLGISPFTYVLNGGVITQNNSTNEAYNSSMGTSLNTAIFMYLGTFNNKIYWRRIY